MNAEEARKITAKSLKQLTINQFLKRIYLRIKETAERGENSISYYYYKFDKYPAKANIELAIQRLKEEGFTVKYHTNKPDSDGRRGELPCWEISW